MSATLTIEEIASRLGEPVEQVRRWRALGLLGADPLGAVAAARARFVQTLLRRGIALDAIARADAEEELVTRYVGPDHDGPVYSLEEAAARVGTDAGVLARFMEAAHLSNRRDLLSDADVSALAAMKIALDAGFPEEALRQLVRVYIDALGRVADAESRLFHFYVHDRLRAEGAGRAELSAMGEAWRDRLMPLMEPMVLYFHRQAWERALAEDAVLHARDDLTPYEAGEVPGTMDVAIAFVDLAGFTSLTDAMGDHAAADVLDRFSGLVREAVGRTAGRVVKQIGDAFMLVFPDASSAVRCALAIERDGSGGAQLTALRTGIHCGTVLYREGDYVGTCVNVAARLTAEAERHEILVTAAVARRVGELAGARFESRGMRRLRGLVDEVEVLVVSSSDAIGEPEARRVDPVCLMELRRPAVAARLTLAGVDYVFCSSACLQRFTATPERYAVSGKRP